jgi:hypothetical protein
MRSVSRSPLKAKVRRYLKTILAQGEKALAGTPQAAIPRLWLRIVNGSKVLWLTCRRHGRNSKPLGPQKFFG